MPPWDSSAVAARRPTVAVVGSINADLVLELPRIPHAGETLTGHDLRWYSGGKGANQAVAAARLGARTGLYAKVGDDPFGEELLRRLKATGVDVRGVETEAGTPTGVATIWVDDRGANAIALAAGANGTVDAAFIRRHLDRIAAADVLLLQLEIPLAAVDALLRALPPDRPRVILDPAPAQPLSASLLSRIDILTPNEHELGIVSEGQGIAEGARRLLDAGVGHVVCTLGARGAAHYASDGAVTRYPAPTVSVVDTTAAGDAFNGALARELTKGPLDRAIETAILAGTLAVTVRGAQPSLPSAGQLKAFRCR